MKKKYILLSLLLLIPALVFGLTYEWVIDQMEYADNDAAQLAYVSSDALVGLDSNTKLLMHMDGTDGGTTFGDSSTDNPKGNAAVTANVNTRTATKKWGTASAEFDGATGYLAYADSVDWDIFGSNADDWTIDFQVKFNNHTGNETLMDQGEDTNIYWLINHADGSGWTLFVRDDVTLIQISAVGEITDTNLHHFAMCKVADKYGLYIDGSQVGYTQDSSTKTFAGLLNIGRRGARTDWYFDGFIDELRIQQSNYFNANPNATPNDTITVPTAAYGTTNLQSYSESTIKQQGTYSLKGVAVQTDSLNDTLTKTLTGTDKLDLTNAETIEYDIYALRTGSNIKLSIHDSGGTTTEHTANVGSSNTNQTESWDISGVSDVNKDDIDWVKITIVDADSPNTFYFDDIKWGITAVSGGSWTFVN